MQSTLYTKLVLITPFSCSSSEGKSLVSEINKCLVMHSVSSEECEEKLTKESD